MPNVVQVRDVSEAIRSLSTLLPVDYVDLFVAEVVDAARTPAEAWARAAMEGSSPSGRFLAWRVFCNLRLAPQRSTDHVAGWKIVGRDEHWIRVQAASWFMTAQIVFAVEASQVSFATFIRYDRPVAARIWGTVSRGHRAVAPGFLAGGVNRVSASI